MLQNIGWNVNSGLYMIIQGPKSYRSLGTSVSHEKSKDSYLSVAFDNGWTEQFLPSPVAGS